MTESEEVKPRRRRTRQEVQRLVAEYGASGLSRSEFCRLRGMTLGTLQRGLKREREQRADIRTDDRRLVRVKVIGRNAAGDSEGSCGANEFVPIRNIIQCAAIYALTAAEVLG